MYFSKVFNVDVDLINDYGAFDISLLNDLPLFIDPFLLFNSDNEDYQKLHDDIIKYMIFLKEKSLENDLKPGLIKNWFHFSEVKQNWLGFCSSGNSGSGLGNDFALSTIKNLKKVFSKKDDNKITKGFHIEKLCLLKDGVGRDNISDFTTNLIKEYLLEYTQTFALEYLDKIFCEKRQIKKVSFNYKTCSWQSK